MSKIDLAALPGLIAIVEGELAGLPPFPNFDAPQADKVAYAAATADAIGRLRNLTGGAIDDRPSWEATRVRIGGIQATCTYGVVGALQNWLGGARKRVQA